MRRPLWCDTLTMDLVDPRKGVLVGRRSPYPAEFRNDAVALYRAAGGKRTYAAVAANVGVTGETTGGVRKRTRERVAGCVLLVRHRRVPGLPGWCRGWLQRRRGCAAVPGLCVWCRRRGGRRAGWRRSRRPPWRHGGHDAVDVAGVLVVEPVRASVEVPNAFVELDCFGHQQGCGAGDVGIDGARGAGRWVCVARSGGSIHDLRGYNLNDQTRSLKINRNDCG